MALSHDEKVAKAKQQVAQAAAKLARLQKASRGEDTAQKVLIGAVVLAAVRDARATGARKWLLDTIEKHAVREHDKKRLAPLVAELRAIQAPAAVGVQQETRAANL